MACVEWPYRGIISIMIGVSKAYPVLRRDAAQVLGKSFQGTEWNAKSTRERERERGGGKEDRIREWRSLHSHANRTLCRPFISVAEIVTKGGGELAGSIEIYDQAAHKEYICLSGTDRKTMLAFDRPM